MRYLPLIAVIVLVPVFLILLALPAFERIDSAKCSAAQSNTHPHKLNRVPNSNQQPSTPFTPIGKNIFALTEAAVMSTAMLVAVFGPDESELSLTGALDEDTWSADLTGTYTAMPFSLHYDGEYDQQIDSGTYSSTGAVGTATWDGSGAWSFTQIVTDSMQIAWDSWAEIVLPTRTRIWPDVHHVWKAEVIVREDDENWYTVDVGEYYHTMEGEPYGPLRRQTSRHVYPKNPPPPPPPPPEWYALVNIELVDEAIALCSTAFLDEGGLVLHGTVTTVAGGTRTERDAWGSIKALFRD